MAESSSPDEPGVAGAEPPKRRRFGRFFRVVLIIIVVLLVYAYWPEYKGPLVIPETDVTDTWPNYGRDPGGARHSPLDQITPDNVKHLEQAWVYRTGEDYTGTRFDHAAFECTPLLVNDTLYLSTQTTRVIALNPETGEEKWVYDPEIDKEQGYSEFTSRGVSAWEDSENPGQYRIFVGTIDARLICIDADSGEPVETWGENGVQRLDKDVGKVDVGDYQVTSPPAIIGDIVVIGSAIGDNRRVDVERGVVRAFSARDGSLIWSWDPVPRSPEDPGWEEWQPAHARKTGAANAWSILSADPERGLVFIPTGSASPDYYGGERLGKNTFANSVVAIRAETGEIVWDYQVVHHDLWDYDVPAQPVLIDVERDGERIPAVAQATKMGYLFILNRETGEPLYEVVEKKVPESDIEGEEAWPTQPIPTKPPPLVPQKLTAEDAWGLTPIDRRMARKKLESLRGGEIYTPPSLEGTIHFPGVAGGTNWGSLSFDAERRLVVLNTTRAGFSAKLIKRDEFDTARGTHLEGEYARQEGTPYGMHREPLLSPLGLPVNPPPWGTLAAVNVDTGEIVWESTLGTIQDLAPIPLKIKWGTPNMGGPISTASGLIFISATMDYYLRAFNTETGEEIYKWRLPAGGQATPMTYRVKPGGKQYVVICAGGHGKIGTKLGDYVIAYALPDR